MKHVEDIWALKIGQVIVHEDHGYSSDTVRKSCPTDPRKHTRQKKSEERLEC